MKLHHVIASLLFIFSVSVFGILKEIVCPAYPEIPICEVFQK
jgi:hypothetical protein